MPEAIACPLDGTTESRPVIEENGYTGRQCEQCGLIYVSPRPSRDEMAELYAEGDAYLAPEFFLANAESRTGSLIARHDVRLMRRHAQSGSLLEIGPGAGAHLREARRQGFDVYGIELNPQQADFIRDHLHIPCVTSLEEAGGLGTGRFDIVYHRDVLSHFYDPIQDMREIRELLRPGGLHVFETGNLGDVDHRHLARIGAFQYPDHLFFYSERSLHRLLELSGFEHVRTYRYSRLPEQVLRSQIWRLTRRERGSGGAPADGGVSRPTAPSGAERSARNALDLTYFGLRLTLGKLAVRSDDPQTLIVFARRTGS